MSWTLGGADFFSIAEAAVTTYPCTFGLIAQQANVTIAAGFMQLCDGTSTNDQSLENAGGATSIRERCNDGAGAQAATSAATAVNNTWMSIVAQLTNATTKSILVNGANKATNATSRTPTGLNATNIGDTTVRSPTVGKIAAAFILDIAAADADILAMVVTAGSIYKSPYLIPAWYGHVIRYWRLDSTGALVDYFDRATLTKNGTPTVGVDGLQILEPTSHQTLRGMRRARMRGMQ